MKLSNGVASRKKILFVITKSNWGGAQRYVYHLATSLATEKYEAVVVLGGTGARGSLPGLLDEKLGDAHIRTHFITSFARDIFLRSDYQAFIELLTFFKHERPDVVHLNSSKAGGLGALAARIAGVENIIFTSHGLAFDEDRSLPSRAAIWLLTWLTFLLCHRVIVISHDNARRARRFLFCRQKIILIHNGIGALEFKTKDEARAELSKRTGEPPAHALWIGTIAELTWNKGLHTLIRAASILRREGAAFSMYIIGEGEERAFLTELIQEEELQGMVHLADFVPDAYRYLPAFDIMTLTSLKEGLPFVLLEAGAAKLPVVASRISGVYDIIKDRHSGLLFEPKKPEALAEKLRELMQDSALREKLGSHLQTHIAMEFSLEQMIQKTTALYAA